MKKVLGNLVLGLMFYNIALAESLLPSCKGTDSFKWTNCFGTEEKNIVYDPLYKDQYKNKKILYEGEYRSGKFHGQGTLIDSIGNKYIGKYKNNKRNGKGTNIYTNGNKYVGEIKDDIKYGQGIYTWANGAKYVGEWKDAKLHGFGTYTFPDGRVLKGIWKKSELVEQH